MRELLLRQNVNSTQIHAPENNSGRTKSKMYTLVYFEL